MLLPEGKRRVSPFYHDLGLDLVGLIGNFWIVEQLLPLLVEQLLDPIPSYNHVSRKSVEAVEVILYSFAYMIFPDSITTTFRIQ